MTLRIFKQINSLDLENQNANETNEGLFKLDDLMKYRELLEAFYSDKILRIETKIKGGEIYFTHEIFTKKEGAPDRAIPCALVDLIINRMKCSLDGKNPKDYKSPNVVAIPIGTQDEQAPRSSA